MREGGRDPYLELGAREKREREREGGKEREKEREKEERKRFAPCSSPSSASSFLAAFSSALGKVLLKWICATFRNTRRQEWWPVSRERWRRTSPWRNWDGDFDEEPRRSSAAFSAKDSALSRQALKLSIRACAKCFY